MRGEVNDKMSGVSPLFGGDFLSVLLCVEYKYVHCIPKSYVDTNTNRMLQQETTVYSR